MLTTLRHDPLVSSDDKENKVYPACACKHIFDKSFMPRDIYNSNSKPIRIIEICKPEVDRDAPLFLFLQSVWVYAGQGLYKGTLAVINMSCGSEYCVSHIRYFFLFPS